MGVILPGVERDGIFPQFFVGLGREEIHFVGVGRERFENSLPCHPLVCVYLCVCVCVCVSVCVCVYL